MNGCQINLLSAFVDGELDAVARARVAAHLRSCPACTMEVRQLKALSASLSALHVEPLKPMERARLQKRVDDEMNGDMHGEIDARIWRFGGAVGLIAASILVVASAWLAVLPASSSQARPGQSLTGVATATPEQWEQVAVTGFVPVPVVGDQVYLADAHLDEWMLDGLNGGLNGSRP